MFLSNRMSSKFQNTVGAVLFFSVTNAFSAPTPLDYEFYSKFPDHGDTKMAPPIAPPPLPEGIYIGLQRFHELLTRMRKARDHLRTDCIGSNSSKMTSRVRGTDVLIWPERFKECEAHARLLDEGNPLFEAALKQWNKAFGSNYTLPRGDPADVQAWNRQKAGITNFPQLGCDDASRSIVLFGQPGLAEVPEQIFKRMKSRCPKQWVLLFEPEEDIGKKAEAAKRICRPGSTYYASDDKSATGTIEMCDESDKFVPKGKSDGKDQNSGRKSGSESDDDLTAELNAIGKGNYPKWGTELPDEEKQAKMIIQARRSSGSHIVAGMEEGVRNQPKAGEIGGVAILGGETGKMLGYAAGVAAEIDARKSRTAALKAANRDAAAREQEYRARLQRGESGQSDTRSAGQMSAGMIPGQSNAASTAGQMHSGSARDIGSNPRGSRQTATMESCKCGPDYIPCFVRNAKRSGERYQVSADGRHIVFFARDGTWSGKKGWNGGNSCSAVVS